MMPVNGQRTGGSKQTSARWLTGLLLLLASGVLVGQHGALAQPDRAGYEQAVRVVASRIIEADNARDLTTVLDLYEVDAILLPPNEAPVVGRAAIRPRYERLFASYRPDIVPEILEVHVGGDWAFVRGWNSGQLTPLDGSAPRELSDGYLMILHLGEGGQWRIARLMWHPSPAPSHQQK